MFPNSIYNVYLYKQFNHAHFWEQYWRGMTNNKYAQWQQLEMWNFKTNKIWNVICVVYRVVKALTKEHIDANCTPVTKPCFPIVYTMYIYISVGKMCCSCKT
jgi:hypothetical protein